MTRGVRAAARERSRVDAVRLDAPRSFNVIEIRNLIDGETVPAASGETLPNVEPATGRAYSTCPASGAEDVDRAVRAAASAFEAWRDLGANERSRLMLRLADLIDENLDELARAESIDTGKPIGLARRVDIPRAAANFRFFATAILHVGSSMHQTEGGVMGGRALNLTLRRPRGVAACISPWNLPLYLLSWKIAPALATGNTVVAKPSEVTPMTAFRLGELTLDAGWPKGVLNIVHGRGGDAGAALVAHERVAAVSFTGGTATGEAIAREAGPAFKALSLELGGKNPFVVFADADFDDAVETAVRAAFANQGQICLCGSRLFLERSIHDRFLDAFLQRVRTIEPGDPLEPETTFGSLVSADHLRKVADAVEIARGEGGRVEIGGERPSPDALPQRCRDGFFYRPTVITGLPQACRTNREEIFGPVVTVIPFDDEARLIRDVNDTRYGLAASVFTRDLDRAHRVSQAIDAGTVWVNCWMLRDLRVPFGGYKHSGVGREGGEEALRFFTEAKTVCVRT